MEVLTQIAIRASNDPFDKISQHVSNKPSELVTVAIPSVTVLFKALPYLSQLGSSPVVLHVDATTNSSDFSLIASLRHSGFVFLQSLGPQDSRDLALASYLIASKLSKPVVHIITSEQQPTDKLSSETVQKALNGFQPSSEEDSNVAVAVESAVEKALSHVEKLTNVKYAPFEYVGPSDATSAIVLFASSVDPFVQAISKASTGSGLGLLLVRVYRPWSTEQLVKTLPKTVARVALAEQLAHQTTTWSPLAQDIIVGSTTTGVKLPKLVSYQLGLVNYDNVQTVVAAIVANLQAESPVQNVFVGSKEDNAKEDVATTEAIAQARTLEEAYTRVLNHLFGSRINVINELDSKDAGSSTNPEYGFGSYLAKKERLNDLMAKAQNALTSNDFSASTKESLQDLLSQWLLAVRNPESVKDAVVLENACIDIVKQLESGDNAKSATAKSLLQYKSDFPVQSSWIIGSDAWAYDVGNSGVHHVLSSGENINMLIIDSEPYSEVAAKAPGASRKKDIGLYAMGFGNVYVASVAVYSSYTQLLQAFLEAEKFNGPSVVLAYLPYHTEKDDALTVLQETKRAVETGYWPLYRYDPTLDSDNAFKLDSYQIRKALKEFLDRENKLTLLSKKSPTFSRSLEASYGSDVRALQKKKAKEAYAKLMEGLSGPPLAVLFASDGGAAESVAKRLQRRAKARGLKAVVMAFDDYPFDELSSEENVVFVTSTAGQGEFPQNGRGLWESLKGSTDIDFSAVNYAVFGMGDSLYWPRKEDKHYYNKPGQDLDAKLKALGAKELVPLGLGDEQDADGYATAYNEWEPQLWTALGVDNVEGADEPAPITNEDIKIQSNYLRGTIAEGLRDTSTGAITANDQQLTKFHGIYMQDDRDVRDERKAAGLEPAYAFMVRVRLPGCVANPDQWLKIDELSDSRGNGTFKITTRGTFQLHGVVKENLKPAIRGINSTLMDTVAACGDVDRNVVTAALPGNAKIHTEVVDVAKNISEHLLPETTAYYEIWLEGKDDGDGKGYTEAFENRKEGPKKKTKTMVASSTLVDHEPLYGPTYLPRKFKINIAVPPYNDVDVYAHDIGLIAIVDQESNELLGFNVLAGGGMGTTHNNRKTYPRTGSLLGYVAKDKIVEVCEKIMLVQRDNGDRSNRKHARLKYTIDDMTVDVFRSEVEKLLGYKFEEGRPYHFESNTDTFGWVTDENGLHHFTTFVENGRVEDTAELQFRTGLREVAHVLKKFNGEFRLTGNQHILICNVPDNYLNEVKAVLAKYKLDNVAFSGLRLSSAACVAFPTCGLAMAESERYLPELVTKLEDALEEYGLRHDSIVMRMTGCPNGCARPWVAEVALVGKAYGAYNLMLGGGFHGQRLNKLYKSSIKEDEILAILKPLFKRWALERNEGEHFGDFLIRAGVIHETTEGKAFWDHVPEDA